MSAVSWLCDRRMLPQRPAGLPTVLRAFLCHGLCPRPGGCSLRGGGPFAWRCAKRGGMLARQAERQGAGMPASRGVCRRCSLPQYRGFAAGADAPVTPGRSVDGFEGVFASWALSALRGLFPSRGRAFLRARRAERRKRECLQIEESLSAVSRLCDRRMLPQRPAGLRRFFRGRFCVVGFVRVPGPVPIAGRAFLRGGARQL